MALLLSVLALVASIFVLAGMRLLHKRAGDLEAEVNGLRTTLSGAEAGMGALEADIAALVVFLSPAQAEALARVRAARRAGGGGEE